MIVSSTVAFTLVTTSNCLTGSNYVFTNGFKVSFTNAAEPALLIVENFSFLDLSSPFLTTSLFNVIGQGSQLVLLQL